MHELIGDRLEGYLEGTCGPESVREIEEHLEGCTSCRSELAIMKEHSNLLHELRPFDTVEPAPGFYARVINRVDVQRAASLWNLLLDPIFGKRLVYATLTAVLLMGTYLATTEPTPIEEVAAAAPEVELARPEISAQMGTDEQQDRDAVLVQLATHSE
jgi:predicted anti-sigma-YlaC factor YlaD